MNKLLEASIRYALHYEKVLSEAQTMYLRGGDNSNSALSLFDHEWSQILAGHGYGREYLNQDRRAASICSNYADIAAHLLDLRLSPKDRIHWIAYGITAAIQLDDVKARCRHLSNFGLAYTNLGDPRRAITIHEEQLVLCRRI